MSERGRTLSLSPARRFIGDLVSQARRLPITLMQRRMNVSRLVEARQALGTRIGWCTLFTKAYGYVAARRAVLRRTYLSFPYPRLYEHPINLASVAIERTVGDEDVVLFAQLRTPEQQTLAALQEHLDRFKVVPVEEVPIFRRALRTGAMPGPLRRSLWWYGMNVAGGTKARNFGTFGVSVVSGLGAAGLQLLTPLTTALNYGVIGADGQVEVGLTYDHRVFDGGTAARVLTDLEAALNEEVAGELEEAGGAKVLAFRVTVPDPAPPGGRLGDLTPAERVRSTTG